MQSLSLTVKAKLFVMTYMYHLVNWFGYLVTMEWWTDLWLNAGFATWISYMATDKLFPEWKSWNQFLMLTADGLHIDALQGSHPIEVEIGHARSVGEIFDVIIYKKGSAAIRMLQGYLGDSIIQKSLSSYMKKYAWGNAKTEDLWSVLSEESGIQVNTMMDTWTKQKGYPVIFVKLENHFLEFEQSQFLLSGAKGEGTWIVPVTFCVGSYHTCKNFMFQSEVDKVNISDVLQSSESNEHLWIKINVYQSGFYRVKYEDKTAIRKNYLSVSDMFGILDDAFALSMAYEIPISYLLRLMDAYRQDVDYVVASKLIDVCYSLVEVSLEAIPDSVNELKAFFIDLLLFSSEKLGWETIPGESHLSALLRGEVLTALTSFGHDKTCREATRRFEVLLTDTDSCVLSSDTRKASYIAVMRNNGVENRSGFELLLNIYREVDSIQEKERILRCMASGTNPDIIGEALNFFVSDEVRDQDIIYCLSGISPEGREGNWEFILDKYGSALLLSHFIRDIISPFCSNEQANEVEEFFATRTDPSVAMNLKQSIEQVRIKARWADSIKQEHISLKGLVEQLACS